MIINKEVVFDLTSFPMLVFFFVSDHFTAHTFKVTQRTAFQKLQFIAIISK